MGFPLELNGAPPDVPGLASAMGGYGHFTAMQVRDGRVRGLGLHLSRLAASTRLLFGSELDTGLVRSHLRHAVAGHGALSARVVVFSRSGSDEPVMAPEILVRTGPPHEPVADPIRLKSVRYQRDLPQVKHLGTFGLIHHSRQARLAGYDDALFVDDAGRVSEASIWNVGFLSGGTVVWPEAAVLPGITYLVLEEQLRAAGVPQEVRPVYPGELPEFDAVFLTNSETIGRPVASVDGVPLRSDPAAARLLGDAYESAAWDEI
ncbi:aminotransferase class IV family protein [Amycolatopsis sp. NBC_00345]|uniref:aminotransferase class IV family protein n=1 Tax=Amycolatopsis sp. NBC_00345 TaxID=2975955 RepID=UPI002E255626